MDDLDKLVALLDAAFSDPDIVNHPRWLALWQAVLLLLRTLDHEAADRVQGEA